MAFQIQDDILDIVPSELAKGKGGVGKDISEGKRTLMVIHAIQKANPQDKKRLIEILNMHTKEQKLRNEAIAILKKYDAIKYAIEFEKKMIRNVWNEVDKILKPSEAKEKLRAFANFLVERNF